MTSIAAIETLRLSEYPNLVWVVIEDSEGVRGLGETFFGSAAQGLQPWVFRYEPGTFQLTDSIATGLGPSGMEIHAFRQPS